MTTVQEAPLEAPLALSDRAARQLANATKTVPQMLTITPRLAGSPAADPARPRAAGPATRWPAAAVIRRRGDPARLPDSRREHQGHQLVWLDNAATTQKPQEVIDRLAYFYAHENSNVHRGAHELAARTTQAYEDARETVASFLGAPSSDDIVFVRGATEAINLVAQSWGRKYVSSGDEIVVSCLEHHANIVPWQLLARRNAARHCG